MKNHKNNLIHVFLISIFLLVGQLSALVHAEQHPFHEAHESCSTFIAAEQTDSDIVIDAIGLPLIKNAAPDSCFIISKPTPSLSFYLARAPPVFS